MNRQDTYQITVNNAINGQQECLEYTICGSEHNTTELGQGHH